MRQGNSEVLLWGGDFQSSRAAQMMRKIENDLKKSGWQYELAASKNGVTIFTLLRETPMRRALVGFFYPSNDAFIFAATEMLPAAAPDSNDSAETTSESAKNSGDDSGKTASISGGANPPRELIGKWFRSVKQDISGLSGYTDTTFEFFADGTMQSIVENQSLNDQMCSITEISKVPALTRLRATV